MRERRAGRDSDTPPACKWRNTVVEYRRGTEILYVVTSIEHLWGTHKNCHVISNKSKNPSILSNSLLITHYTVANEARANATHYTVANEARANATHYTVANEASANAKATTHYNSL